jgi:AcrR family transcriptional regulator
MTATGGVCAGPGPVNRTQPHGLRSDACRNRDAILAAARDVFARQGLQAPLEDIARQAGVGIATVYRRFPSRERLVAAALLEKVRQYADAAEQARANPDPWAGFAQFVRRSCALQANDRGLSEWLSMTLPASEEVEHLRATVYRHVTDLAERAKAAGRLRPDFVPEDLLLVLIANAAVLHVSGPDATRAWPRLVALFLDAFQHTDGDCLPTAPTAAQLSRGMAQLAAERRLGGLEAAPSWPS